MNIIPVDINEVDQIFHISDIHIRLFKRHSEYRDVFNTLFDDLKQKVTDDSVILLTGDILHSKLDISPEMIDLTSYFLVSLANIAPTIVYDGNHDLNLSNLHRLRSLSPIINNINHKDLHYIIDSGVYKVGNVDLALFAITDKPDKWPTADDCDGEVKIATYHGPVYGAKTDTNYTISSRHVEINQFNGFDIVMLGDIHKAQNLKESNPIIRYAGSLIQQNHGENLDGHGYTLWNIPDQTYEHVEIPNEVGYVTLELNGDDLSKIRVPNDWPKNIRMRIFTSNLRNSQIKKFVAMIKRKYNVLSVSINPSKFDPRDVNTRVSSFDIGDLSNINVQNNLIKDYLEHSRPTLSEDLLQEVLSINKRMNGQISYTDQSRNIHWKPVYFKFSNLFSYGEDNYIDFTNLTGAHGIFAPNATGKSSSMESMIFALFDKTPRAFRGDHIMNIRKDTFECELCFLVNDNTYYIKRIGTKNKNGSVRVDVDFWQETKDGKKINLNGDDRFGTNANIRSVVGTYEDFILTTLSGQNGSSLFIDKSHTERKNLLNQFMGLNIFESLYSAANEEIKQIQGVLKKFSREDFTDKLAARQEEIDDYNEKLKKIQAEITEHHTEIDDYQIDIETLSSQKINLPVSDHNVHDLELSIESSLKKKEAILENIEILKSEQEVVQNKLEAAEEKMSQFDPQKIASEHAEYERELEELKKFEQKYTLLSSAIDNKKSTISSISQFKYNPDCEICIENNKSKLDKIEEINAEISELNEELARNKRWIEATEKTLEATKESYDQYVIYLSLESNVETHRAVLDRIRNDIDKYQNQITSIDSEIADNQNKINEVEKYQDSLNKNKSIDEKISDLRKKLRDCKDELDDLNTEKISIVSDLSVSKNQKDSIMKQLSEISDMEKDYEAYKYYLETISRDGLPYYLISKTIPSIESEINSILSQIVPFSIALDVDGKNFGGRIVYDHERSWPLENSSGMERFISSLAIRVALLRASNLPKSNFLIVDEGMGSLDTEYLHGMQLMFDLLKAQFDFVIIISHLDNIRDMVDDVIEITKTDGYSHINTLN